MTTNNEIRFGTRESTERLSGAHTLCRQLDLALSSAIQECSHILARASGTGRVGLVGPLADDVALARDIASQLVLVLVRGRGENLSLPLHRLSGVQVIPILIERARENFAFETAGLRAVHIDNVRLDLGKAQAELARLTEVLPLVTGATPAKRTRAPDPAAGAVKLARGTVKALPAANRSRYHDEFTSELYELAAAGASRWKQLAYSLRLLNQAWVLRAELRATAKQVRP